MDSEVILNKSRIYSVDYLFVLDLLTGSVQDLDPIEAKILREKAQHIIMVDDDELYELKFFLETKKLHLKKVVKLRQKILTRGDTHEL